MNYVELVMSGKYKESDLTGENKAFVEGMRYAQKIVDNERHVMECMENKDKSIANKIVAEIAESTIGTIVTDLETDICEAIVSALDEATSNDESKQESK